MDWYEKVFEKNKKEVIRSAIISIIVALAFSLWYFTSGGSFEWKEINPVSVPSLFSGSLYSALVFITLGAFLYWIRFYKLLHSLIVRMLGNRELYRGIKRFIWISLILAMYFWVVPTVVDLLNATISFFYNVTVLTLYLFPPFGIFLIVFVGCYAIYTIIRQHSSAKSGM